MRSYFLDLRAREPAAPDIRLELEALASTLEPNLGFGVDLQVDPETVDLLTSEAAAQVLYIAREAASNVIRHAGARRLTIRLQACDGQVTLCMQDDGRGFDPAHVTGRGSHGLRNMAERAQLIGARLVITSRRQIGTEVRVEIPARSAGPPILGVEDPPSG
jgi:signal transduction histidine kinase